MAEGVGLMIQTADGFVTVFFYLVAAIAVSAAILGALVVWALSVWRAGKRRFRRGR